MTFDSLGLSEPILKAIKEKGYSEPSPIQAKAIPVVLSGKDIMAAAQTGTGKTAGFTLPILELLAGGNKVKPNHARVLIITPTRELAAQIAENIDTYGKYLPLSSTVVFGGVKINPQMMRLRKGIDILVATPGRLLDLYSQNAISFDQLEVLVLDEADRMLDMGFIHDIRKVLAVLPEKRQNLMFSATFSDDIRTLARTIVNDPVEVSVAPPNSTVNTVKHWVIPVDKKRKPALLAHLIKENSWDQVLVFSRTKHGANRLTTQLIKENIEASAIHGNKSQGARTKALAGFKSGKVRVLVATDIAARGIDISQLPHVINVDLPNVPEDYVHRIGRTGRAGAEGEAISLVSADEIKQLSDIERLIKKLIPREYEPGFEPEHEVPESRLDTRPIKPKKPKKPVSESQETEPRRNNSRRPASASGRSRSDQNRSGSTPGRGRNSSDRNSSGRDNTSRNTADRNSSPSKPSRNVQAAKPRPITRDENGDVNGNLAGVETHNSDKAHTKSYSNRNRPGTGAAKRNNRPTGKSNGKSSSGSAGYAGRRPNNNVGGSSQSSGRYGGEPSPNQGGTGYQGSESSEEGASGYQKPRAYVGGGGENPGRTNNRRRPSSGDRSRDGNR